MRFARKDELEICAAERVHDIIVAQLRAWDGFEADVVTLNNTSVEIHREKIRC